MGEEIKIESNMGTEDILQKKWWYKIMKFCERMLYDIFKIISKIEDEKLNKVMKGIWANAKEFEY